MKKIKLKIGTPYLDIRTSKIRVIRSCNFGYVTYDVFIAEMNSWVTQVMPYYQFKGHVEFGRFILYQGELPKANFTEVL